MPDLEENYQVTVAKYNEHAGKRADVGLPPKPLTVEQVEALIIGLRKKEGNHHGLIDLLLNQVSPGASEEADLKADFLKEVADQEIGFGNQFTPFDAITALGQMQCGKAITHLIELLQNETWGEHAQFQLSQMALIHSAIDRVKELAGSSDIQTSLNASLLLDNWSNASWFERKPAIPQEIQVVLLELDSAPTTDALSPAKAANSRTDIPAHAQWMLTNDIREQIVKLQQAIPNAQVALFADKGMFGAGSSRLSATNSVSYWTGKSIEGVPVKKHAPIVLSKEGFAPIFQRAIKSDGGLAIVTNTSNFKTGDVITIRPLEGKIYKDDVEVSEFHITPADLEKLRAGSATFVSCGKVLTQKAAEKLGIYPASIFAELERSGRTDGQTLAEKILTKAAGERVYAGDEGVTVKVNLVGSQDTTGGMTANEMSGLGVTRIAGDVTMLQSQCHKAGLPTADIVEANEQLVRYMRGKGAIGLQLGDGVIHSWLNKMNASPWDVTVGGDSHTRNSLGIAFGADSQTVAYAAATGTIVMDNIPETVKVVLEGELPDGVSYRDVVNAIALEGRKQSNGKNPFENNIIEMHGIAALDTEIAFAFSDATAERNAIASVTVFDKDTLLRSVEENQRYVKLMIANGYDNNGALQKLAGLMQQFIDNPIVPQPDEDAKYAAIIKIDLSKLAEPLLSDPRLDPDNADNVKPMSELAAENIFIQEVFIGSCMTTAEDFAVAAQVLRNYRQQKPDGQLAAKLWVAPPRPDIREALIETGDWQVFEQFPLLSIQHEETGASLEAPGCSLCMGNQKRTLPNANMLSTSTRPYKNRMGDNAMVYLCAPAVAAVGAILGKIPTVEEYKALTQGISIRFGRPETDVLEVTRSSNIKITTGPVPVLQAA